MNNEPIFFSKKGGKSNIYSNLANVSLFFCFIDMMQAVKKPHIALSAGEPNDFLVNHLSSVIPKAISRISIKRFCFLKTTLCDIACTKVATPYEELHGTTEGIKKKQHNTQWFMAGHDHFFISASSLSSLFLMGFFSMVPLEIFCMRADRHKKWWIWYIFFFFETKWGWFWGCMCNYNTSIGKNYP